MAHCFRWKIILPPTRRLGIDSSDYTLYERDAERIWLAAPIEKQNSDERELLAEATDGIPVSKSITLASGQITPSPHDTITVELVEPARGRPAQVAIHWPTRATVCSPASLDAVIAVTTRTLTNSVLELARVRART